jgi:hypothetical protein
MLTQGDVLLPLPHLNAEVVGERAEIAHLEASYHLTLEAINVLCSRSNDDQIVHIHADDKLLLPPSPRVEHMLCGAASEPKLAQGSIELGVPRPRGLSQPIERLARLEHLLLSALDGEARSLLDEDCLHKLAVEESKLDVEVVHKPSFPAAIANSKRMDSIRATGAKTSSKSMPSRCTKPWATSRALYLTMAPRSSRFTL